MERRREDLGRQVAEDRQKLHQHEANRFPQFGGFDGTHPLAKLATVDPARRFELERPQQREPLRSIVKDALGDRRERDFTKRGVGSNPNRVQRRFEETKKGLRGQTCGGSLEPRVYAEGMVAVIKHGVAMTAAKNAFPMRHARANDPPSFSLTAFFQPERF